MKLKGINPIEQNLEWFVLTLVGVIFVGVLAMQILLSPNNVTIDNQSYPPQDAYKPIEDKAREIASQLDAPSVTLPQVETVDLSTLYDQHVDKKVSPRPQIYALGPATNIVGEQVKIADSGSTGRIAEVNAPAPARPDVRAYRSTIDPYAVSLYEGLAEILPEQQPLDKASVTIQTSFSGSALRGALLAESENARSMPPQWWTDSMAVFGLEVEREALSADGDWVDATIVQRMPGGTDVFEALDAARGFQDLEQLADNMRSLGPEIQRPSYYPVIAGPAWITPSEAAAAEAVEAVRSDAERLLKQRDEEVLEKERLEDEAGDEPEQTDRAAYSAWRRINVRVERSQERIDDYNSQLEAMGVDPEVGLPEEPTHDMMAFEVHETLFNTESLPMWFHDMYVEPGKTYRYRTRVLVTNPAFGRAEALPEDQQALADSPTMPTSWSAWSDRVEVPADTMFFLIRANTSETLGAKARATAEIYRFFYGYWRKGLVTLDPGDVVAKNLDLPTPDLMPIFEVTEGGQRDAEPDPGPTSLMGMVDAFLLDVAQIPGQDRGIGGGRSTQYEAYLRSPSGQVEVRRPLLETARPLYAMLTRSAEIGLRQGIPEPKEAAAPRGPRPNVREPVEDSRRSGGGGGGGGGGG